MATDSKAKQEADNGPLNGENNDKQPKNCKSLAKPTCSNSAAKKKKKRRDKSDLGENFVAPDGGWGWLVSIASGINILVTFAVAQQFGIIFREHMYNLGITNSELTTIINTQIAVSAITGLLNGPLFRRYSYRQVAVVGSFLTFIGLFMSAFAESFLFYVWSFSCCYGFGRGLTVSASSLAVYTFFKHKRRTATAYQFGVAGLGPIVCPYIATYLIDYFGVQGTVLIFAGLSLHTVACSLIYQPVKWHVKKTPEDAEASQKALPEEDEEVIASVVEPEIASLPLANDGWYGSRTSLNLIIYRTELSPWERHQGAHRRRHELKRLSSVDYSKPQKLAFVYGKQRSFSISYSIREVDIEQFEKEEEPLQKEKEKLPELEPLQKKPLPKLEESEREEEEEEEDEEEQLPLYKKIVIFFDLDLLRDITYVNLAMGLTLINFVEINFAILTPFILDEFGFAKNEIAIAMSVLGFCDLVVRFLVPLITAKMHFSNQTFFIIGILGMCFGRIFLSFTRNFPAMVTIFVWLGLNKAFRTVFWSLIIPGYVPLKRLPAAAGLQLLMSGIFSMAFGPLIGLIRENTNYAFTLNFLNALCFLAIFLWILENIIRKRQRKSKPVEGDVN